MENTTDAEARSSGHGSPEGIGQPTRVWVVMVETRQKNIVLDNVYSDPHRAALKARAYMQQKLQHEVDDAWVESREVI